MALQRRARGNGILRLSDQNGHGHRLPEAAFPDAASNLSHVSHKTQSAAIGFPPSYQLRDRPAPTRNRLSYTPRFMPQRSDV
ncbi:hypothetical protein SAQ01S_25420 [Sphingomonas aquatilis NBRC 16722]|nr:hypothetical protein SAQ01S_25420 [Sphingomonas aquatilis NBRC 16722]